MARAASKAAQFALPLDWSAAGANDPLLVVGKCNSEALRVLAEPLAWPVRCAVLVGPPCSGRSLIGRVFARASGGQVFDNPANHDEESLFHAWNTAQGTGVPMLIIADTVPGEWGITLPDLRSRLAAVPIVRIGDPDDGYARDYIEAQFAQRGMVISPDVAEFVVRRMHRSHATLAAIVAALDTASLAQGRRVSKRLASEVLRRSGLISDDLVDQTGVAA